MLEEHIYYSFDSFDNVSDAHTLPTAAAFALLLRRVGTCRASCESLWLGVPAQTPSDTHASELMVIILVKRNVFKGIIMKRAAKQTWGAMRTSEGALPKKMFSVEKWSRQTQIFSTVGAAQWTQIEPLLRLPNSPCCRQPATPARESGVRAGRRKDDTSRRRSRGQERSQQQTKHKVCGVCFCKV